MAAADGLLGDIRGAVAEERGAAADAGSRRGRAAAAAGLEATRLEVSHAFMLISRDGCAVARPSSKRMACIFPHADKTPRLS